MTDDKIILKAEDLDGLLLRQDSADLSRLDGLYREALPYFRSGCTEKIIELYGRMDRALREACAARPRIHVCSFAAEGGAHAEAGRVVSKLRSADTERQEFIYYSQRAYEMLFRLAYAGGCGGRENHIVFRTPVSDPVQMYAVRAIPDIDSEIEHSVMCVMLRGALLPSMIMSKEIEDYSSHGYITPFALFKISRNDSRKEGDMEYILDLKKSFFNLEQLDGRDLIFADPMNATGGSLVAVVKYLQGQGVAPRSIKCFNVISALKGGIRVTRAFENCTCYTLWMDPALNEAAYILPGLGDAGDRLNGRDEEGRPRNIMQLIADYGSAVSSLYRSQLFEIERAVFG